MHFPIQISLYLLTCLGISPFKYLIEIYNVVLLNLCQQLTPHDIYNDCEVASSELMKHGYNSLANTQYPTI